ncbi:L-idonate 5-dehydrogenase [Spatholobus suberectus]|nr:L-idonate 5-dehydrogenase [Spatholobus suberectus]
MCEPLTAGVHAYRRANIGQETNVLIIGAGPLGLVTMLAAQAFGAPRTVIVDVHDHRLSVAKSLGADDIVKVSTNIQGAGIDVTIDSAGFDKTMSTALSATQPGGKVCLVGMCHSEMAFPFTPAAASLIGLDEACIHPIFHVSLQKEGSSSKCYATTIATYVVRRLGTASTPCCCVSSKSSFAGKTFQNLKPHRNPIRLFRKFPKFSL